MVRDNRIKEYRFSIGSLTATNDSLNPALGNSGGNFKSYTDHPINGMLQAVEWCSGNNTNGSLFIFESGGAGFLDGGKARHSAVQAC